MLSLLLPVKNAQGTLDSLVHEILDLMAENEHLFELLIIDDSSTDATIEVAHELCRCYPQLRYIRCSLPLGRARAIAVGLKHSRGEVVMLVEGGRKFRVLRRPSRLEERQAEVPPSRPKYLNRLKKLLFGDVPADASASITEITAS